MWPPVACFETPLVFIRTLVRPCRAQERRERNEAKASSTWTRGLQLMRCTYIRKYSLLFGVLVGLTLCTHANGQTAVDGAIGGPVQDTTGAVVGGATVIVHNIGTDAEQTAKTD